MIVGTNVAQSTEQCRMTLKNGRRCRYPSRYNGFCGLHWHALISNRPKLTRRELILISLSVAGNIAQVIQTGISIHDHHQPKPPVTSIARVVADETVKVTESVRVRITGVAAIMTAVGTVTASGTVTARPAPLDAAFAPAVMAAAPVDVRRAMWQMRVHPKRSADLAAGRLLWNQLQFPNAPDKWTI